MILIHISHRMRERLLQDLRRSNFTSANLKQASFKVCEKLPLSTTSSSVMLYTWPLLRVQHRLLCERFGDVNADVSTCCDVGRQPAGRLLHQGSRLPSGTA